MSMAKEPGNGCLTKYSAKASLSPQSQTNRTKIEQKLIFLQRFEVGLQQALQYYLIYLGLRIENRAVGPFGAKMGSRVVKVAFFR